MMWVYNELTKVSRHMPKLLSSHMSLNNNTISWLGVREELGKSIQKQDFADVVTLAAKVSRISRTSTPRRQDTLSFRQART